MNKKNLTFLLFSFTVSLLAMEAPQHANETQIDIQYAKSQFERELLHMTIFGDEKIEGIKKIFENHKRIPAAQQQMFALRKYWLSTSSSSELGDDELVTNIITKYKTTTFEVKLRQQSLEIKNKG